MPKWVSLGLFALAKLPVEKLFFRKRDSGKALEELETKLLSNKPPTSPTAQSSLRGATPEVRQPSSVTTSAPNRVTTPETVEYQKRELGKEIMLLEKHLQQKCKIAGKACDCCEKHPIAIEALAQETLGITGDPLFGNIAAWAKEIAPITTEDASRSGEHDGEYPGLAVEARKWRKRLMGTTDVKALLSPQYSEKVSQELREIINRAMDKKGGNDGEREQETL